MVEAGRDDLTDELRRERLPVQQVWKSDELQTVVSELSYVDLDALLAAIGEHHVSAKSVAQRLARALRPDDEQLPSTVARPRRARSHDDAHADVGVHVEGLDDVMVRLANCCTPVPGDGIIGFVTRGRGVSVHRSDCANAVSLMAEQATRMIEVEWDGEEQYGATFVAGVEVVALDRSRLLRDVTNSLADHHVNILSCQTLTGSDRVAKMRFEFEFADPATSTPCCARSVASTRCTTPIASCPAPLRPLRDLVIAGGEIHPEAGVGVAVRPRQHQLVVG